MIWQWIFKSSRSSEPDPALLVCLASGLLLSGCHHVPRWKGRGKATCDAEQVVADGCDSGVTIRRRVQIVPRSPTRITADHELFAQELVAAFNSVPNLEAYLGPPITPVCPANPAEFGPSPALPPHPEDGMAGPPVHEEVLIVELTEIQPYRPMRLSAVLERRNAADGMVISQNHQTWNGPMDLEPLNPHPFNRQILRRPPPLEEVEQHELSRLSPSVFLRNVSNEIAADYAAQPLY